MAQIDVSVSTDFSADTFLDVTNINFVSGPATATFASSQFNNVAILNNVSITGSAFIDGIVINGGGVDASAWEFGFWVNGTDTIVMNGSAVADVFVGSRRGETINANGGNDLIVSGHSLQSDVFNGGLGNDTFRYLGFTSPVNDTIDGGAGDNDVLEIAGVGTTDFTLATINRVENLVYASGGSSLAQFSSNAFGTAKITTVTASASSDALSIFTSASFDLGNTVTFAGWNSANDQILITGTSGDNTISGSSFAETIEGGGGTDTLSGRGGDDDFVFSASASGSVNGGAGFDTIRVFSSDVFVKSLQAVSLASIEAVAFDARGTEANVAVSLAGHQIGSGAGVIGQIRGSVRTDGLIVFTSDVNGFVADLSGVDFIDWTAGVDSLVISTVGSADDVVTGADVITSFNLSTGADSVTAGSADDTFNTNVALSSGFNLDGEGGTDTLRIGSLFSGTMALEDGSISDIEILDNEAASALIYVDGSQIGGPGRINTVDGSGDSASTGLLVTGRQANLANVTFTDWGQNDAINLLGTRRADTLIGSSQSDVFLGSRGGDRLSGRDGNDSVTYQSSTAGVTVSLATGSGAGGHATGDRLFGIENVTGSGFGDTLIGNGEANSLSGEAGNDVLNGRQGADTLAGNDGDDTFLFTAVSFSPAGAGRDRIIDFSQGAPGNRDVIDVFAIDASTGTAGNNSFSLVTSFTGEGQIVAVQNGNDTILQFNTTGADGAEMEIVLVGFTATNITAADFIL